jgi:hypothetical protein
MDILAEKEELFKEVFAPGITHQDLIKCVGDITDWFPVSVVSTIKCMLQNTYKAWLEHIFIYLYILLLSL